MLNSRSTRRPSAIPSDHAQAGGSFRYRTELFVGAWRDHAEEAVDDAVRAGQARRGAPDRLALRWLVKGMIERRANLLPAEISQAD